MSCSETLNNAFLKICFISVLMVALVLHCGLRTFSSPGARSVLLSMVASLLPGTGSHSVAFRSCRTWAPWLWRMHFVAPQQVNLPGPRMEATSSALAGGFTPRDAQLHGTVSLGVASWKVLVQEWSTQKSKAEWILHSPGCWHIYPGFR